MSFMERPASDDSTAAEGRPFPPVNPKHIINCSYDQWYPKYRSSCLPSRIIPLPAGFVDYLNEDGIILADDDEGDGAKPGLVGNDSEEWRDTLADPEVRVDSLNQPKDRSRSASDAQDANGDDDSDDDPEPPVPPNQRFPDLHRQIRETIAEFGGAVVPKLNWSAPKDAAWISQHQNTLKCTSPNDVYVLLKSSSFVSHDLDHAFDGCMPTVAGAPPPTISRVLVLRPYFLPHPAMEFRCFVKERTLVGATPRDLNYYPFLLDMRDALISRIDGFFEKTLRFSFPDDSFVFDVYIPEDHEAHDKLGKVCLIDINPWAAKTDTLLWGWDELLDIHIPKHILRTTSGVDGEESASKEGGAHETADDDDSEDDLEPELRLVEKNDPAAYNFSSAPYSAHKLPKDVVDASTMGQDGMREFLARWKEMQVGSEGDSYSG